MSTVMIADEHNETRALMTDLCKAAGYDVTIGTSTAAVMVGLLKKTCKVVLLGSQFDELQAVELIPLLKRCCKTLPIIVVSSDFPAAATRRLRREGIFYHLLRPVLPEDYEELQQAIACALKKQAPCFN